MAEILVGKVTHFFDRVGVAVVELEGTLRLSDTIKIGKGENFFEQKVGSMQIDHKEIKEAKKGQEIGLKVEQMVRSNDLVFKL